MKKLFLPLLIILTMSQLNAQDGKLKAVPATASNPLLVDWKTPFQTPPFSQIKPEHYIPAFEQAIKEAEKEIFAIQNNYEAPTFQNTILALDRAGEKLNRVAGIFFNILECDATTEMQDIANKVQPMITEYSNSIYLNDELFKRVKLVYDKEFKNLKGPEKMLLEKTYNAFLDNGANLSESDKQTFRQLSLDMSQLTLQYGQNALAAKNAYTLNITNVKELAGIPDADLEIAKEKAKAKGLKGYVFDLSYPSSSAILKYADNRELRHTLYMNSCNVADGGEYDNTGVILRILQCRNQMAQLLGYNNYAEYALHDRMAQNPDRVYKLLDELKDASMPVAQKEVESLKDFAHKNGLQDELQRWDFSYYSEKQRTELFKMSTEELKPYFKLENVIDGVFSLAENLYGLNFKLSPNIEVYHPDVKAYEVYRKGQLMAILYLDFHPRETKRSGAWMTSFREESYDQDGKRVFPLVSLVMNFTPSTAKNPSLLTFDEVTTFLHEFGHALHGMLTDVPYQSISGTSTPRDFVELPSQMNENWATQPEFLKTFAFHYKTGELIPETYIKQLKEMRKYLAGYSSLRQLSFGYLDMMWHTIDPGKITEVRNLEHEIFDEMDVMPVIEKSCMSTSFSHIFAGGYAAGYYGYKWAEMLEADAFSMFEEKGVMNKEVANKYVETILSQGGSMPAMEMFSNFRGREPQIDALLKRDGLK